MARGGQFLDGTETVAKVFRGLSDKAVAKITQALNQGAAEIAARAKIAAPVDEGDLRRDIDAVRATEIRSVRGGRAVAAYVVAGRGPAGAYARVQEFGRAPSDDHPGHRAQPFLFPAYWSVRRRVRARVARAISAAAREVRARRG